MRSYILSPPGLALWSVDQLIADRRGNAGRMKRILFSWESWCRSIVRIVLSFTFSLHRYRHLLGAFNAPSPRRTVSLALDLLPGVFGVVEILGGTLLLLGLFARPAALILAIETLVAYAHAAALRGPWPIPNGGTETLIYMVVFMFLAAAGAGTWGLDSALRSRRTLQWTSTNS